MELNSGWTIVFIEGSQVIISKHIIFPSLKFDFVFLNSACPDEMSSYFISVFTVCQSTRLLFLVNNGLKTEDHYL